MSCFRTIVHTPEYGFRIGHEQRGLLIGSCFATSIGEKLEQYKMPVNVNPFGVVYNPVSAVQTLERLESGTPAQESDLWEHQGIWFSFSHHGSFASPDKNTVLKRINQSIAEGHKALQACDYLVLTLGTAWVYELIASGRVVNNCHKVPATQFRRFRVDTNEIVQAFERLLNRPIYKNKKNILTVSPIRHTKDEAIENQWSKAILLTAAHRLAEQFENVSYFPAYEIMMDDLRDYRFYEADMIHPSKVAVDYIWERFCDALIHESSLEIFKKVEKINAALQHRPFNPDSQQHQDFKNARLAEIIEIKDQYPFLDFSREINYFSA